MIFRWEYHQDGIESASIENASFSWSTGLQETNFRAISAQRSQGSQSLPAQEMWRNWTSLSLDQVGKSCESDCRVQIGRNLPPTLEEILVGKIAVLGSRASRMFGQSHFQFICPEVPSIWSSISRRATFIVSAMVELMPCLATQDTIQKMFS